MRRTNAPMRCSGRTLPPCCRRSSAKRDRARRSRPSWFSLSTTRATATTRRPIVCWRLPMMKLTRAGRYMVLGNNTNARSIYEGVIQASPNAVIALNNLAWIYLDSNLEAAASVAKRAYDLAGTNGDVVDTYGSVLLQQGKVREAVAILEEAVKLAPDNEEIRGHLETARTRL
ncbi:MAG: hypothetical protein CMQ24_07920 [Gammaproteobacteria bacterium]|nr:hypothetical protein [Gammaproteobacteria bacterium]